VDHARRGDFRRFREPEPDGRRHEMTSRDTISGNWRATEKWDPRAGVSHCYTLSHHPGDGSERLCVNSRTEWIKCVSRESSGVNGAIDALRSIHPAGRNEDTNARRGRVSI